MPFVLIIIGVVLVTTGLKGDPSKLYSQVETDLVGANGQTGFLKWILAILVIGAIGYIPDLKNLSRAFMSLVLITLFVSNGGFFSQFQKQFNNSTPKPDGSK